MAVGDRDPHSGYLTTGHEWNGITELNTPVPRAVYVFLIVAALFTLGYWVLMPAWPIGSTYTKGLLGADQRASVADSLKQATVDRSAWTARIESAGFVEILNEPSLMPVVRQTGRTLFGDNCAACHGREARGGPGFPNLTTASWLWGGTPEAIAETIRVGINSPHPESRKSQMLAFGRDGLLPRGEIEKVLAYVRTLSNLTAAEAPPDEIAAGKTIFMSNCASCHRENGTGNIEFGAPNLTDKSSIYGSDLQAAFTTVWGGRQGHMPSWEARLSAVDRKILTLYLVDLRGPNR